MEIKVGDKVYAPSGQGVVIRIDEDENLVRVARITSDGNRVEEWFAPDVVKPVPTRDQQAAQVSYTFRAAHPEFNPVQANVQLITGYITERNQEWTLENLETAYKAVAKQLAPKPVAPVAVPVAAPAVAVTPTPAVPPVPQLTRKDIGAMSADQFKAACADPEKAKQIESLGIPIVRGSYYEMLHRPTKDRRK
jgi:hypothetical protein